LFGSEHLVFGLILSIQRDDDNEQAMHFYWKIITLVTLNGGFGKIARDIGEDQGQNFSGNGRVTKPKQQTPAPSAGGEL